MCRKKGGTTSLRPFMDGDFFIWKIILKFKFKNNISKNKLEFLVIIEIFLAISVLGYQSIIKNKEEEVWKNQEI
ncbi:hypothetical protein GCM10008906_38120 [Clostridium oceanicum]|uniref:Uncharacterized protein n=2 Tax=Clostridium oceanicum TaxID=1543 RepID=A0ABP3V726_9CLOT